MLRLGGMSASRWRRASVSGRKVLGTCVYSITRLAPKNPIRLRARRRGTADQEGVEVLQDLTSDVVDRAVALIDDDDVEELGRNLFVVDDRQRFFEQRRRRRGLEHRTFLVALVKLFLALEDRVQPLDRRNDDLVG